MAPPSKCSPKQLEFLVNLIPTYLEEQKKGRLDKFWVYLAAEWFREWEVVEDMTITDATERQTAYGNEVAGWKKYIKRWFQNHSGKYNRVLPYGRFVKQALKTIKPKRRPQLLEVYCRLYYEKHVMQHIKTEVERLTILKGKKPTRGQKLRLVRSYAIKLFDVESDKIKAEVTAEYERRKEEVDEKEAEEPQAMADAIRTIPAHFTGFAQFLSSITGWRFTLLAGGPDPKKNGEIKSVAVHFGENRAGLSFGQAYQGAKDEAVAQFGSYLCSVYTPSECAARSLYPTTVEDDASVTVDCETSSPDLMNPAAAPRQASSDVPSTGSSREADALGETGETEPQFDHLNENINWEELNLFDPSLDFGLPPLSLSDELAAPLTYPFHAAGDMLGSLPDTFQYLPTPSLVSVGTGNTEATARAIPAHGMPAVDRASPGDSPAMPAILPIITPTSNDNPTAPVIPPFDKDSATPLVPPVNTPATTDAPLADLHITNEPTSAMPAVLPANVTTVTNAPSTNLAASTGTPAKGKAALASSKGTNKRTRDPTDERLIVPGKRIKKAKVREEVEAFRPRGKENRRPRGSQR
ncbi:hypothetical protein PLEOSDRAFT_1086095 [Pleurotus ostreatus PC15]|uniref:Uncharacterized protein n=1 Tax=Pleurotus ostreatus (strain PC15) TaxID=1137138 RepID=A0A067N9F3_PLEO1|nr:hypothetical protein PLEOSDRAFT_1086095 [Pleurotus ostreatus PC15]